MSRSLCLDLLLLVELYELERLVFLLDLVDHVAAVEEPGEDVISDLVGQLPVLPGFHPSVQKGLHFVRLFVLEMPQQCPPAACVSELLAVLHLAVVEPVSLGEPAPGLARVVGVLPVLCQHSFRAALPLAEPAVPFVFDWSACVPVLR